MRSRTTPWKTFLEEREGDADEDETSHGPGRIARVPGSGVETTDALGKIERWAEETVSRSCLTEHRLHDVGNVS